MERITFKVMSLGMFMLAAASTIMAQPNDGTMPDTTSNNPVDTSTTWLTLEMGLLDLHAESDGEGVLLEWVTATENDMMYYLVERSSDAQHFEAVGLVHSIGNSTNLVGHDFVDAGATTGTLYYRLRMVRVSLLESVSNVVSVEHLRRVDDMRLFPCPVSTELQVQLPRDHGRLHYVILDSQGRCHLQSHLDGPTQRFAVEGLRPGAYTLYVLDARGSVVYSNPWLKM